MGEYSTYSNPIKGMRWSTRRPTRRPLDIDKTIKLHTYIVNHEGVNKYGGCNEFIFDLLVYGPANDGDGIHLLQKFTYTFNLPGEYQNFKIRNALIERINDDLGKYNLNDNQGYVFSSHSGYCGHGVYRETVLVDFREAILKGQLNDIKNQISDMFVFGEAIPLDEA